MIHIFHPPAENELTGGYVFNYRVGAELSDATVFAVQPRDLPAALAAHHALDSHLLVDSLYIGEALDVDAMAKHRAVALVHHLPSLDPGFVGSAKQAQLERAFLDAASSIIVTSQFMRSLLGARRASQPVAACPPGVDDAFFEVTPHEAAGAPAIVTVANLEPRKGYLEHIEPIAALAADIDFHWHIAGAESDPEYAARVRQAAIGAGLKLRVTFHGRLERPALCRLLARACVQLFPTRFESYGMAVTESLAAGVPVVAPAIGEITNIVRDGETGLLATPENPHALVESLGRVLTDASLRARLRAGALANRNDLPRWPAAARRLRETLSGEPP